ncbi:DUF2498 family protein [Tatumella citrea]|uniref:DUF2498 domain-containing protein n=1 Tax=Tatumella citrea TaxID=53336 RepID=A0A1Y0LK30_TATCI|nr:DUF2498 family protein [Tatumella citrea]ARU94115.1 hypothetical protein A7K98_10220 [Tatumella citrea]ARU98155.1 hypothetical protein A7K99_10220 [Tatumella citrea]
MNTTPETLDATALITLANQKLQQHKDYFPAMKITSVRQQGPLLIFSGPWFADTQGMPTQQSTLAFNMFKFLTVELSPHYYLKE